MSIWTKIQHKLKCFMMGHSFFIEEYDKNGMIVAEQCIRCGKRHHVS